MLDWWGWLLIGIAIFLAATWFLSLELEDRRNQDRLKDQFEKDWEHGNVTFVQRTGTLIYNVFN